MNQYPIPTLLVTEFEQFWIFDKKMYKKYGLNISREDTLEGCLRVLEKKEIELILLDLDFIDFPHGHLCREIKKIYKNTESQKPGPLVVIMGSYPSTRVVDALLASGANLFLELPMQKEKFIEKIKKSLLRTTRSSQREESQGSLKAEISSHNVVYLMPVINISMSGIFVSTDVSFSLGDEVSLKITSTLFDKPIKAVGAIVRQASPLVLENKMVPSGLGVKFVKFIDHSEKDLQKIIQDLGFLAPDISYFY